MRGKFEIYEKVGQYYEILFEKNIYVYKNVKKRVYNIIF